MLAVVQRVSRASVRVDGAVTGAIGTGLLVLLGVHQSDDEADAAWLAAKCAGLRVFPDDERRMNRSLDEAGGAMLVVSQFTLLGDCVKGRRPSFSDAAPPAEANRLYERFCAEVRALGLRVETGVFQAMMEVDLVNDGPVTLLVDSAPWKAKRAAGAARREEEG
jgi:D-tyrosyl-tRNA(Tyr) deacylase